MRQAPGSAPLAQLAKFGTVGVLASAVHAGVYMALVKPLLLTPLPANFAGFGCAFVLSFLGHRHWTFAAQGAGMPVAGSLARFLVTALLGLASNTFLTWLLTENFALPAESALVGILLVTPVLTFVCSKYWAFAPGRHS